ncbi:RNA-directed DNA polymerase, eukaryota [Tanacetum coccineum]
MVFKVDFAKACDSIRWDYLDDVLRSFGFGVKWCSWIKGSLTSSMASILVNGSPTAEFQFHCGLKQGDPLTPYLFILIMESLHLSFSRVVYAGIFKGIKIDNAVTISHIFYADDAVFIGEWSDDNLNRIMHVLHCFSLASGLMINFKKSHLLGVGIPHAITSAAAMKLGCSIMKTPFKYLGVMPLMVLNYRTDLLFRSSHCKKRVGNGLLTRFWSDIWVGDSQLSLRFPRIYTLELNKDICVADKLQSSVDLSLRRSVRGGVESHQLEQLLELLGLVILSNSCDRWYWDLNGNGFFCVKDVRNLLDDFFLPKADVATRWIKQIPIKINIFAWRVFLDRLPSKMNLLRRGVQVSSLLCPICISYNEDVSHSFFSCSLAVDVSRLVCRWWDVVWTPLGSYSDWLSWFKSIRMGSNIKCLLEGVFYVSWWCIWNFRNHELFAVHKPRKAVIFDDIVERSFLWCSARCNTSISWNRWCQNPSLISL